MSAPIARVLARLADAKKNGTGWKSRCPAHDDAHASLSLAEGDDRRVLVKCHAGCTAVAIVKCLGLEM